MKSHRICNFGSMENLALLSLTKENLSPMIAMSMLSMTSYVKKVEIMKMRDVYQLSS